MSTHARCTTPIDIIVGRTFSLPLAYTGPSGATATTGMGIAAALFWTGQDLLLVPAILNRDDVDGTVLLRVDPAVTATLPVDRALTLRVTYTDPSGDTGDFDFPLNPVRI